MSLKTAELQKVVRNVLQEKQKSDEFCEEIKRAFGPSVVVRNTLASLVEQANYCLDVFEHKGRLNEVNFSTKVALKMSTHSSPTVRRFVARVLPENAAISLLFDKDETVRSAAAKKAPLKMIQEAIRKYPQDILLRETFKNKKLMEVSALEASITDSAEDLLSDYWYEKTAKKIIQDYSHTLDVTWKNAAVRQLCSSARATSRLPIDPVKLMNTIDDMLSKREEERLEKLSIKESKTEYHFEKTNDVVEMLVNESLSPQEYIDQFTQIAKVKFSEIPPGIMKYRVQESFTSRKIPVSCTLPHKSSPRHIDEVALDAYVKHWNTKQKMLGEPFQLAWSPHPESMNKISFRLELK